jgi:membrane protease YdiL (CAAX protease family)
MKSCSYCGKQYSDDAVVCAIDGQALSSGADGKSPDLPSASRLEDEKVSYKTFPDYQWSQRDAWKCIGVILMFQLILRFVVHVFSPYFPPFWTTVFGYTLGQIIQYVGCVFIAAYFARTETLASFWKGFGLDTKPSEHLWFGAVVGLIIRAFGHFMIVYGLGKGVTNYDMTEFKRTVDVGQLSFLASPILCAPLFEELVNRGFLYKAFRNSYSVGISVVLMVMWTGLTHWPSYLHSWIAVIVLSAWTVVQCYLREKSTSIWDCIICHFIFNASILVAMTFSR